MNNTVHKKKVLFLCTHNSARSQMAEGFLRTLYGERFDAFSAGTHPSCVHPYAIRVMKEEGIDLSTQRSQGIDDFLGFKYDYVITVCDNAQETCPFFPEGEKYIHKSFEDPARSEGTEEEKLALFRRIRNDIKEWIHKTFENDNA